MAENNNEGDILDLFDMEIIEKGLMAMFKPGDVLELRILKVGPNKDQTKYGYFSNFSKLAEAAQKFNKKAYVYITLNPVKPELLKNADNKVVTAKTTTPDAGILKRVHFGIDLDPKKKADTSSTNGEHELSLVAAQQIRKWLSEAGWPDPIFADSGNGSHLVYDIDLPNDEDSARLLSDCLAALNEMFGTERLDVDQKVFNAGRIWKLYGTWGIKGENTEERPHRISKILSIPKERKIVPLEQLFELAALKPFASDKEKGKPTDGGVKFDIEGWMNKFGIEYKPGRQGSENGVIYDLPKCPFGDHDGSCIGQRSNGAVYFKCQHNSCKDHNWAELRKLKEPDGKKDRKERNREYEIDPPEKVNLLTDIPLPKEDVITPISFDGLHKANWIKLVVDYIGTLSTTYPEYSFQNSLAALSATARRRLYFRMYGSDTYTNLITLNLGQSGYAHKTGSFTPVKNIVRKANLDVLLPSDVTPEGLVDEIADIVEFTKRTKGGEEEIVVNRSEKNHGERAALKSLWKDEAGEFYAKCNKNYMGSTKELLCELYDCPDSKDKKQASKRIHIDSIYFGMNLSTTPQSFVNSVLKGDVHTGFLARHSIMNPEYEHSWKDGKEDSDQDIATEHFLARILEVLDKVIPMVPLRASLGEVGLKIWNAWSKEREEYFRKIGDDAMGSFFSRFQMSIWKMAILIELGNIPYNLAKYARNNFKEDSPLPDQFEVIMENGYKLVEDNKDKQTCDSDYETAGISDALSDSWICDYEIANLPISVSSLVYSIRLHDRQYIPYTVKLLSKMKAVGASTHPSELDKVLNVLQEKRILLQWDLIRLSHVKLKDFDDIAATMLISKTAKHYLVKGKTKPGTAWVYIPPTIPEFDFRPMLELDGQPTKIIFEKKKGDLWGKNGGGSNTKPDDPSRSKASEPEQPAREKKKTPSKNKKPTTFSDLEDAAESET